ncbi:MAG: hypothetical protein AB7F89_22570 [Pirellulaceae bacterium]
MVAQMGADGSTLDGTPKQRLASAFGPQLDDPLTLTDTLRDICKTRRRAAATMGRRADLEAGRGLARIVSRQMGNTAAAQRRG